MRISGCRIYRYRLPLAEPLMLAGRAIHEREGAPGGCGTPGSAPSSSRWESARKSTIPLQRPATIVHTSGSSGVPKAVLHSCGNHYYNALGSNANLPLTAEDRWLLDLPLHHVAGLGIVFRCLLAGAAVVMPDRGESLDAALDRYGITHLSAVPTQLRRLLKRPGSGRRAALRYLLVGGCEVPRKLLARARARGLPVFTSYGCTEMASQVTTTGIDSTAAQRLTSGRRLPYRRLRVDDEGEILLAAETLFMGYVERGEVTRPVDSGGWFATGDLGRVDEDGYLSVTGRRDNRFFCGGETIHPEEIERALVEHGTWSRRWWCRSRTTSRASGGWRSCGLADRTPVPPRWRRGCGGACRATWFRTGFWNGRIRTGTH